MRVTDASGVLIGRNFRAPARNYAHLYGHIQIAGAPPAKPSTTSAGSAA
jgi:hypothetical protein